MASKTGIKFETIKSQNSPSNKKTEAAHEVARVRVPCLSDAILYRDSGGQEVLEAIDRNNGQSVSTADSQVYSTAPILWKLKKIKNKDGSNPKPGDTVRCLFERNLRDESGRKLSASIFEQRKRRGQPGAERYHEYTLDADCCFECGFRDAMDLLTQWGVHYKTGVALTGANKEKNTLGTHGRLYVEIVEGENEPGKAATDGVQTHRK